MRLLYAALFVIFGMAAAVVFVTEVGVGNLFPVWAAGVGLALLFLLLCVAALVFFSPWWANVLGLMRSEELRRRMEAAGLLVSADCRARRAFGVRGVEDEGPHYFLELDDGRVLYLSGLYLYDYVPINDEDEEDRPRRFPCTEFTVHRHKTEGDVVELECRGMSIEPQFMAPPLPERVWDMIDSPEDGQVLTDRPYDLLVELATEATR